MTFVAIGTLRVKIAFSGLLLNEIQVFCHCCFIGLIEKSIPNATFIIGKYHVHSLNCTIYFPLIGYAKYRNGYKHRKNKQIFNGAPIGSGSELFAEIKTGL